MARKNKNLISLAIFVLIIILTVYGRTQGWLPLKIENEKSKPAAEQQVKADITARLEIGDKTYQAKVKADSTAYDLMKILQSDLDLKFSAKEYAGMGALIEEIDGVKNDVKANKFWIFYVNGQPSQVGVSGYVLKNNDVISWKYEAYSF